MKPFVSFALAAALSLTPAAAQPGAPQNPANVVLTRRAATAQTYGGPTRAEGRSYNFTPLFLVYPDARVDEAGAGALLEELGIQSTLDDNYGVAMVVNPVGAKYDAQADFDAFVALYDRSRSGNLKVIGIGAGATFVNQVLAPKAASHIAGILTVGGNPARLAKGFASYGVPAYVAGKTAKKVAAEYIALNGALAKEDHYVNPDEELLTVWSDPSVRALREVFADAWKKVLGRNYRFNNYKHTQYEGQRFDQYGPDELEPYLDWESLDMKRIIVEQPQGGGRGQEAPKWLWYEYWPEELLEGAAPQSVPIMVLLHGNTNDPRTQAETSGFIQVAGEERFLVVEMEWQGSVSYQAMGHDGIENVLLQLLAKYPQLDPSRIYAEGLSAGSMTASALGIKKSHVFAAVGGHSGGIMGGRGGAFPGMDPIWNEATQKRGAVEMPYCSVLGTADNVVPFVRPDNWERNGYFNAWKIYEQMNGMPVVDRLDFSVDPLFGQRLRDRETIRTNKGAGIVIETGQLYKGDIPLIKIVAVVDYGHWNFQPTAQIMWDFFKQYRRDPETRKLIYLGDK
ncbi:MAG: hypothetical protein GXY24_01285 [Bacteroidales bacterium]|jgi:poly(3-hydroxybutyrate) depolymerase|nr:hypothetical protein [Bacteroidales bacterium]